MPTVQSTVTEILKERFAALVLATHAYCGNETVIVKCAGLLEICRFLHDDPSLAFNFLMDLSCVDYRSFGARAQSAPTLKTPSPLPYFMKPKATAETWQRALGEEFRFDVVYHLYSLAQNYRLRLKVPVSEADPAVDSVCGLWAGANWFEREVWDMFGIRFHGHPDLRRILLYEPFQGHPLRKDYPVNRRQPLIGPMN